MVTRLPSSCYSCIFSAMMLQSKYFSMFFIFYGDKKENISSNKKLWQEEAFLWTSAASFVSYSPSSALHLSVVVKWACAAWGTLGRSPHPPPYLQWWCHWACLPAYRFQKSFFLPVLSGRLIPLQSREIGSYSVFLSLSALTKWTFFYDYKCIFYFKTTV